MTTAKIPPKERPEWVQMILGEIPHSYKNYVLQVRTYQLHKEIVSGKITQSEAIDDLYALCSKYALAVQHDFRMIFKTW